MEKKTSTNRENNIKEEINMKEFTEKVTETLVQMNKKTKNNIKGETKMKKVKNETEEQRERKERNRKYKEEMIKSSGKYYDLQHNRDGSCNVKYELYTKRGRKITVRKYCDTYEEAIRIGCKLELLGAVDCNVRWVHIDWDGNIEIYYKNIPEPKIVKFKPTFENE